MHSYSPAVSAEECTDKTAGFRDEGPETISPTASAQMWRHKARPWEWQYRIISNLAFHPRHCHTYMTLTFDGDEPCSKKARKMLRKQLDKWSYHFRKRIPRRVDRLLSRELHMLLDSELEFVKRTHPLPKGNQFTYLVVEERGSKNGRIHFHLLLSTAIYMRWRDWKAPGIRWPHGFMHHKLVTTDGDPGHGLATYISKYITKSQGVRPLCSYNYGLERETTLLSSSNFQALAVCYPRMAQRLLRRLSLTPNYPTCQTLNYLLSRQKLSTTSVDQKISNLTALLLQTETGSLTIGYRQLDVFSLRPVPIRGESEAPREGDPFPGGSDPLAHDQGRVMDSTICKALTRAVIRDIRSHAVEGLDPSVFAGLRLFGRPRPITQSVLSESKHDTALWFQRMVYPKCRGHRAGKPALALSQRNGHTPS